MVEGSCAIPPVIDGFFGGLPSHLAFYVPKKLRNKETCFLGSRQCPHFGNCLQHSNHVNREALQGEAQGLSDEDGAYEGLTKPSQACWFTQETAMALPGEPG